MRHKGIVYQQAGFVGERHVQAHHVGLGHELRHRNRLSEGFVWGKSGVFVVGKYLTAKAAESLGGGAAVETVAHNSHREGHQFYAPIGLALPHALPHFTVSFVDVGQKPQQHTHGVFGHGIAVAFIGGKKSNISFFDGL